ncbi:MAG TPA: hypothetical protein VFE32_22970 [Puia sp.]|nr:hypothetical protein [Puia sp.]
MRSICFLLSVLLLCSCQRKLSTTEVRNNLEKAMAAYLRQHHDSGMPPLRFDMVDVSWQENDSNYQCRFTIKLYRPDGSDTTGVISGRISKDFSAVSAK